MMLGESSTNSRSRLERPLDYDDTLETCGEQGVLCEDIKLQFHGFTRSSCFRRHHDDRSLPLDCHALPGVTRRDAPNGCHTMIDHSGWKFKIYWNLEHASLHTYDLILKILRGKRQKFHHHTKSVTPATLQDDRTCFLQNGCGRFRIIATHQQDHQHSNITMRKYV